MRADLKIDKLSAGSLAICGVQRQERSFIIERGLARNVIEQPCIQAVLNRSNSDCLNPPRTQRSSYLFLLGRYNRLK